METIRLLDSNAANSPFEPYRGYLKLLARTNVNALVRRKLDESDLVQQTLLKAHLSRDDFRGGDEAAKAAWLKRIMVNTIADAIRDMQRGKRDAGLERSIEAGFESSTARLGEFLTAQQPSPSEHAVRGETLVRLANALEALPVAQREALLLKHCEGYTLDEVAERLGRTPASVASLMRRGLKQLRELLAE